MKSNNKFNFERDFFIGKQDRTQKIIEISITFTLLLFKYLFATAI